MKKKTVEFMLYATQIFLLAFIAIEAAYQYHAVNIAVGIAAVLLTFAAVARVRMMRNCPRCGEAMTPDTDASGAATARDMYVCDRCHYSCPADDR